MIERAIDPDASLLDCCEPVQTPGCIQDHGALLVLRLADLTVLSSETTDHNPLYLCSFAVGSR